MEQLPFWQRLTQHPAYDEYWQDQAVDRILAATAARPSPPCSSTACGTRRTSTARPAVFNAVKASPNAHLVLGPWHHGQANGAALALGPLDWGSDTGKWFRAERDDPVPRPASEGRPAGRTSRASPRSRPAPTSGSASTDWPPACARGCPANLTPLYLAPGNRLSFTAPAARGVRLLRLRPRQARSPTAPAPTSRPGRQARPGAPGWSTTSASPRPAPTSSPTRPRRSTAAAAASPALRSSTSSPRPAAPTATGWSS